MNITLKKDEETGESYIDIADLAELFEDISIVDHYVLTEHDDGSISLQFFDKDENVVNPKK